MTNQQDIETKIKSLISEINSDPLEELSGDSRLVGSGRVLDSLGLVELCLRLEELSQEYDFDFDWTSASAMSVSKSMFRSISALAEEFKTQMASAK